MSGPTESREPIGVSIQSYTTALYGLGSAVGYYSPPGVDPGADLTTWNATDPGGRALRRRRASDRRRDPRPPPGLRPLGRRPAPLLLLGGWTDDLFPPAETLRVYNALRAANPAAPVSLQLGDLGHARGSNKANADHAFNDAGSAFFDAYLRGTGSPPAPGRVTAFTQTCPQAAAAGGPFGAASWPALHPGAVLFGAGAAQTVSSSGGNPATSQAYDPISGGGDACHSSAKETAPGTAYYDAPAAAGYTLLGRPTISATIATSGANGQLAARLWDVAPGGSQVLVTRGVYRLLDNQSGKITFQLNGNGYRFEKGHVPRLELLGRDAPYYRASNGSFSVAVSKLQVVLPVAERPGSVPGVVSPPGALQRARPQAPAAHAHGPLRAQAPHAARARAPDSPQGRLEAPRLPRQRDDHRQARQAHAAQAQGGNPPQDLPLPEADPPAHARQARDRARALRRQRGARAAQGEGPACATSALGGSFRSDGPAGGVRSRAQAAAWSGRVADWGMGPHAVSKKTKKAGARIAGLKATESVCPYCAVGCGQVVYTRDGELVDIEGNPRSPINQGTLCPKGSASRQLVQQPGRLTKVKYRAPGRRPSGRSSSSRRRWT